MRAIRTIIVFVVLLLISANIRWRVQFAPPDDQFTAGGLTVILLFILVLAGDRYIKRK